MTTSLPKVTIESTGTAQTAVPFTFGQVFAPGHLTPTDGLTAAGVPLQVDVKATHPDGSVRHAIVSGVLPRLGAGEVVALQLAKAIRAAGAPITMPAVDVKAILQQPGAIYSASLASAKGLDMWLAGPIAGEMHVDAELLDPAGKPHPRLTARFGIRWFGADRARVETIIENTKTFTAGSNETYDVEIQVAGRTTYSAKGLTHYHHARWRRVDWMGAEPALIVHPDIAYLIATRAVSNYDQSIVPAEVVLASYEKETPGQVGPMKIGPLLAYMPNTGGRADIGPLPSWTVMYLLSRDKRARAAMLSIADGAASWSTHYRDENTGYPVRTDNEVNKNISTHWNMRDRGPLPVPRCVNGNWDLCATPYEHDTAHQPSMAYLPYLITGEHYYLEELHFWAAMNPLGTDPGYSGNGAGLLRWQQVRGQAWSLRTLGHAAYITPDAHPMKSYFAKQLDANLDFYKAAYAEGNPNNLGAYDGSGEAAFQITYISPWQDDFLTWSFGYLAELGFEKAVPVFNWKAKFVLGRMNGPGYSWINAAAYQLAFRDANGEKIKSFSDLFRINFDGPGYVNEGGGYYQDPNGVKYVDLPSGSQAQADYLGRANNYPAWSTWKVGRMTGYADSAIGFPANMQPALALAAASGLPDADKAWRTFAGRAEIPNYSGAPQFAIVPRGEGPTVPSSAQPAPEPTPVPAPTPVPTTTMSVVDAPAGGIWQDVGAEGAKVDVPPDTIVRYGAGDRFVTARVGGAFVASNAFFGRDPAVNVVKKVQKFTPGKPGKITTSSSTKLAKAKNLTVTVFDPESLAEVQEWKGAAASTKGAVTFTDAALVRGVHYAVRVSDAAGEIVLIHFPVVAV